jgi:hypothetical protein
MALPKFFRPKQAEVLSHWYTLVPNFQTLTKQFYTAVEQELQRRRVPGLSVSHVQFAEGGPFSAKRVYLRLTRERLVFDICAAPFGTSYFFSCRFAELPAVVSLWQLLIVLITSFGVWSISVKFLGFLFGNLVVLVGGIFIIWLLHNTTSLGLYDLDAMLLRSPAIGPVYERFFRKETYYRIDTRLMYLETVPAVVQGIVQQVTAASGITHLKHHERKPILGELYQSTLTHMVVEPPSPRPAPQPVPVPRPLVVAATAE